LFLLTINVLADEDTASKSGWSGFICGLYSFVFSWKYFATWVFCVLVLSALKLEDLCALVSSILIGVAIILGAIYLFVFGSVFLALFL
jgi:hypothetical protein